MIIKEEFGKVTKRKLPLQGAKKILKSCWLQPESPLFQDILTGQDTVVLLR